MAPKTRFTKQDIVLAAFDIAQTDGIESITIRKVAERLGTPSRRSMSISTMLKN